MPPRSMVSAITEMSRGIEGERGFGFSVGVRFTVSFVYRSQQEAEAARERMLVAVRGAELVERWRR